MIAGIVGSERTKFTEQGENRALAAIMEILKAPEVTGVVSGHCHLGGIDIWAEMVADVVGKEKQIFPPKKLNWSEGYKPRNLQIAKHSDLVYCITVDCLPVDYTGMRFPVCYHCARAKKDTHHIKSGGCWTAIEAEKMGKPAKWIVIDNADTPVAPLHSRSAGLSTCDH